MQQYDFSHFHYLVIDSSFFVNPLDDGLCAALGEYSDPQKMPFLCASSTFHSEFRQYSLLLEAYPAKHAVYLQNLQKLKDHNVHIYIHSYTDYNNSDQTPRHDTWSLLNYLLRMNTGPTKPNILLLTGNELLLRRVVLSALPISIYDFKDQSLSSPDQLASRKAVYELSLQVDKIVLQIEKQSDTPVLFDAPEGGKQVRLVNDLNNTDDNIASPFEGTEGAFYSVEDHPELVAKVYHSHMFSRQLAQNIQDMKRFRDADMFPWAMLPENLLYTADGNLAGYLMKKVDASCPTLHYDSRFNNCGNALERGSATLGRCYLDTLQACLGILRQIAYMSNFDILLLDLGKANFCLSKDSRYVYFLDTCSVCFGQFFSDKYDPNLEPQYADRHRPVSKLTLIDLYLELVHLFMMSMMTLGSDISPHPISKRINFLEDTPERNLFHTLVPENLKNLYWVLFCNNTEQVSPFSIEVLMEEFSYALEVVSQTNPTYQSLMNNRGHQGEAYPPDFIPEVLPCEYGSGVLITTVEPGLPTVYERPDYLKLKTPPAVHTFSFIPARTSDRILSGYADSSPLPPQHSPQSQRRLSRTAIAAITAVVLVLTLLICFDFLRYAGTDLGLTLPEFWVARFDTLRNFLTGLTEDLFKHSPAVAAHQSLFRS